MLSELHIENMGVIASLDLVLGPGLTVLTGETGAGKTMLIGAINLLVGGRAEASLIRPGADEARVEGRFVIGEEELVLSRVIPADGRSRAYVNGRLATVGNLATEGERLIDLHGQHAHQSLLSTAVQRAALDRFGKVDLDPLRAARARLTEIDAALAALGGDGRARAREIDLLRFQVRELDDAALTDGDEDSRLEASEELLSGAQAHREAAYGAIEALTSDGGALDSLGLAIAALQGRGPFAGDETRMRGLVSELSDVAAELRDRAERIDEDPERLAAVRERRQLLRELQRKYGDTLDEVIAYRTETAARLEELESYEARAATLDAERSRAEAEVAACAARLGAARRASAPKLAEAVAKHLASLAMAKARVEIEIGDDPGDDVTFLLAANPGEPAHPLAKVASGGELARSMLALRLVLTEAPETLIFDEVDAGIGGSAAVAVGRSLAQLGERHQVLVVTHLAQVAALADHQIVVSKRVGAGRTTAQADAVRGDERIDELARMLSGSAESAAAREHAAELLRSAGRS
jgi:DNA repair protein RecN (Recombination protein N)